MSEDADKETDRPDPDRIEWKSVPPPAQFSCYGFWSLRDTCFEQQRKRAHRMVNELQKLGYMVVPPS